MIDQHNEDVKVSLHNPFEVFSHPDLLQNKQLPSAANERSCYRFWHNHAYSHCNSTHAFMVEFSMQQERLEVP